MKSSIFFYKELTTAELGNAKTHEKYIRFPNNFNYEAFFHNSAVQNGTVIECAIEANDITFGPDCPTVVPLRFVFFANSNNEKRMPSLGTLFQQDNVQEGDIVCIESRIEDGQVSYYIRFHKKGTIEINPSSICFSVNDEEVHHRSNPMSNTPLQVIYYGAPGTGKSHKIKGLVKDGNHVRTTFHPDSDYASFVGAYKPTMIQVPVYSTYGNKAEKVKLDGEELSEKKIQYDFVAQSFLTAYVEAWKRLYNSEVADKPYYLVIEEINRGNCAQIFGDLFQLLDRDDNGESSYSITADRDIQRYLAEQFDGLIGLPEDIASGAKMRLPSNFYIYATMNTSDQSLFPIDSAFKRRWDWEYVPIKDEKKGYRIVVGGKKYLWSDFLDRINDRILSVTQSDDKQMGYWFVHLPEGQKDISTDKFIGKVLFYLWNDVFKDFGDGEDTIFVGKKEDGSEYELRFKHFFTDERDEHIHALMRKNGIAVAEEEDEIIAEDTAE